MTQDDVDKTIKTIEEEFVDHERIVHEDLFILGFVLGISVGFMICGFCLLVALL